MGKLQDLYRKNISSIQTDTSAAYIEALSKPINPQTPINLIKKINSEFGYLNLDNSQKLDDSQGRIDKKKFEFIYRLAALLQIYANDSTETSQLQKNAADYLPFAYLLFAMFGCQGKMAIPGLKLEGLLDKVDGIFTTKDSPKNYLELQQQFSIFLLQKFSERHFVAWQTWFASAPGDAFQALSRQDRVTSLLTSEPKTLDELKSVINYKSLPRLNEIVFWPGMQSSTLGEIKSLVTSQDNEEWRKFEFVLAIADCHLIVASIDLLKKNGCNPEFNFLQEFHQFDRDGRYAQYVYLILRAKSVESAMTDPMLANEVVNFSHYRIEGCIYPFRNSDGNMIFFHRKASIKVADVKLSCVGEDRITEGLSDVEQSHADMECIAQQLSNIELPPIDMDCILEELAKAFFARDQSIFYTFYYNKDQVINTQLETASYQPGIGGKLILMQEVKYSEKCGQEIRALTKGFIEQLQVSCPAHKERIIGLARLLEYNMISNQSYISALKEIRDIEKYQRFLRFFLSGSGPSFAGLESEYLANRARGLPLLEGLVDCIKHDGANRFFTALQQNTHNKLEQKNLDQKMWYLLLLRKGEEKQNVINAIETCSLAKIISLPVMKEVVFGRDHDYAKIAHALGEVCGSFPEIRQIERIDSSVRNNNNLYDAIIDYHRYKNEFTSAIDFLKDNHIPAGDLADILPKLFSAKHNAVNFVKGLMHFSHIIYLVSDNKDNNEDNPSLFSSLIGLFFAEVENNKNLSKPFNQVGLMAIKQRGFSYPSHFVDLSTFEIAKLAKLVAIIEEISQFDRDIIFSTLIKDIPLKLSDTTDAIQLVLDGVIKNATEILERAKSPEYKYLLQLIDDVRSYMNELDFSQNVGKNKYYLLKDFIPNLLAAFFKESLPQNHFAVADSILICKQNVNCRKDQVLFGYFMNYFQAIGDQDGCSRLADLCTANKPFLRSAATDPLVRAASAPDVSQFPKGKQPERLLTVNGDGISLNRLGK